MKKHTYILIAILISSQVVNAQYGSYYVPPGPLTSYVYSATLPQWYQNLEKYWFYRYRFINDFTYMGKNPGENMIAYRRTKGDITGVPAGMPTNQRCNGANCLDFAADQTNDLGSYMAVLGTEYEQLKQNGFSTAETLNEIQYAQNAFDRLRKYSIDYYSTIPSTPNVYPTVTQPLVESFSSSSDDVENGFFIRDDVPFIDFLDPTSAPMNDSHYVHFNRQYLLSSFPANVNSTALPVKSVNTCMAGQQSTSPFYEFGSGAIASGYWGTSPNYPIGTSGHFPNFESQDQFNQLYLGEMTLIKYLDNTDPNVPEQRLRCENALYHTCAFLDQNGCGPQPYWAIPDPVTPSDCAGHEPMFYQVFLPNAFPSMFGLNTWFDGSHFGSPWSSAASGLRGHAYNPIDYWWYGATMGVSPLCCNYPSQNVVYTDGFSCYGAQLAPLAGIPVIGPMMWLLSPEPHKQLFTFSKIQLHAFSSDFCAPHLPLIFELNYPSLHFYTQFSAFDITGKPMIKNMLDAAPVCGPWCYENSQPVWNTVGYEDWNNTSLIARDIAGGTDWSGNNRLSDAEHRQGLNCTAIGGGECHRTGNDMGADADFNGLDYMWLFNLYSLQMAQEGSAYLQGMMNPYYADQFSGSYPDPAGIGSPINKLKLSFLEYVNYIGQVSSTGWLSMRGAQVIDHHWGFWVHPGGFYHGFIQDYNCSGGDIGDGPYNFAELNPLYYRTGDTTAVDTGGWRPIAYYQPGYKSRPVLSIDTTLENNDAANEIMNNLPYYLTLYKDSILKTFDIIRRDSAMLQRYGIDIDSMINELYPNQVKQAFVYKVDLAPNPTMGVSYLSYTLSQPASISIVLANAFGQDMSYLIEQYDVNSGAGTHKITLHTDQVIPGVYYITIKINGQPISKKISIIN